MRAVGINKDRPTLHDKVKNAVRDLAFPGKRPVTDPKCGIFHSLRPEVDHCETFRPVATPPRPFLRKNNL